MTVYYTLKIPVDWLNIPPFALNAPINFDVITALAYLSVYTMTHIGREVGELYCIE